MRVLVTGGAGFIGCHVCEVLVALGHTVVAADNLLLGRRENIAHLDGHSDFEFIECDVADLSTFFSVVKGGAFSCVFHLAANSDIAKSHASPDVDFDNTFRTTFSVLEAMRRTELRAVVFASTSAVYGEAPGRLREDYGPLKPISHYGAAKLASEGFISSYCENYGMQSWIARFPNVVGDRATHGAIFDFAAKLRRTPARLEVLGDGRQVKPYLHVDDLVKGLLAAWKGMDERTNIFNVAGPTRLTVRRIAEIVVEESGLDAEIVYRGGDRGWIGDVPMVDYDISKLCTLGWEPQLDSEGAVRAAARSIFKAER